MRELLRPFARIHIVGLALIGCLALALLTGAQLWECIGLLGAIAAGLWGAILLYRDLHQRHT